LRIDVSLIITTYPQNKSANVGDLLITHSFVELARSIGLLSNYEAIFREEELNDEIMAKYQSAPIFMPGFSVSRDVYPRLFKLGNEISDIPLGLIPFGCTWQHVLGYAENAEKADFTENTFKLLSLLAQRTGPIAVRDHQAGRILMRHSIPSVVVGDCAWYHLPSKGKTMRRPKEIRSIVVTTPQGPDLADQSVALLDMLLELFPKAEITLSHHSRPLPHAVRIMEYAVSQGVKTLDAFGDISVFDLYENYDLHVGHRLHGHIGFLRRRIPSVLLVEDARSRGFSTSIPVGCFDARQTSVGREIMARLPMKMMQQNTYPDEAAVQRVRDFLTQELLSGFLRYIGVASYLDTMLEEIVLPQLSQKVALAKAAIASAPRSTASRKLFSMPLSLRTFTGNP
jgi:Polysaccharide pyruvyl transferase